MTGCGVYGKLSSTGDFIRFGLPAGFVDTWDKWLQTGIADARAQMGGRWDACYLSAPIWRFSASPGAVGGVGMIGVLMASVDRVGRRFPLTLAVPCDAPHGAVHLNARGWFEQLEDIALATLDDLPLEALKSRLAEVAPPLAASVVTVQGGMIARGAGDLAPLIRATHVDAAVLWSARTEADMRLMPGTALPEGAAFAALFDLDAAVWQVAR